MTDVFISLIRIDGGTQSRAAINEEVVKEYAELRQDGVEFPAIILFYDGQDYWLADGFHRYHSAQRAGMLQINAEIHQGTRRDAVLYSVGANSEHGLRRTNEDKRRAVSTLLDDDEWVKWSDREIARRCGVSNQFVSNLRKLSVNNGQIDEPQERTVTRNGTTYQMNKPAPAAYRLTPANMLAEGETGQLRYIDPKALKTAGAWGANDNWIARYNKLLETFFQARGSDAYYLLIDCRVGYIALDKQAERIIRDLNDNGEPEKFDIKIVRDGGSLAVLLPAIGPDKAYWYKVMRLTGVACYFPGDVDSYNYYMKGWHSEENKPEETPEPEPDKPLIPWEHNLQPGQWVLTPEGDRLKILAISDTTVFFHGNEQGRLIGEVQPCEAPAKTLHPLQPGDMVMTRTGRRATVIHVHGRLIECEDSTGRHQHYRETLTYAFTPSARYQAELIEPEPAAETGIGAALDRLAAFDEYGGGNHDILRDINHVRVWLKRLEQRAKADVEMSEAV